MFTVNVPLQSSTEVLPQAALLHQEAETLILFATEKARFYLWTDPFSPQVPLRDTYQTTALLSMDSNSV